MDDVAENHFEDIRGQSLQTSSNAKENLDDRAGNGKAVGIKKDRSNTGWFIKNVFESKRELPERYESTLLALKNGTPIRLNIIKLPEKNPGKN
mgnify:CR=1 FL=1